MAPLKTAFPPYPFDEDKSAVGMKVLTILLISLSLSQGFVVPVRHLETALYLSTSTKEGVVDLCSKIENEIERGENPRQTISQLESLTCGIKEPNRQKSFLGEWHVWWTDCPPPSNGQLGPFQGTAEQAVEDSSTHSYKNILKVPPGPWLGAVLDGVWEEWDGVLLEDGASRERRDDATDYGSNHWKVTFKTLSISLFGYRLIEKAFPPGTSRVWRTTYLDDNVRIVRAGKTGRIEDEYVFYTKRVPR